MLVETGRLDIDAGIFARGAGVDEVHRCGEVLHIQAYAQLVRQAGIGEGQAHTSSLFLHIHTDGGVGQIYNDIAFTLLAALEVQAADCAITGSRSGAGYRRLVGTAPVTSSAALGRSGRHR